MRVSCKRLSRKLPPRGNTFFLLIEKLCPKTIGRHDSRITGIAAVRVTFSHTYHILSVALFFFFVE